MPTTNDLKNGMTLNLDGTLDDVMAGRTNPYEVATEVLDGLRQGSTS